MADLLILAVADLAVAVKFYADGLGFRPVVKTPVYVELAPEPGEGRFGLGLYLREGFARNVGESPGRCSGITATELYFRVKDLVAAQAALAAVGARPLSAAADRPWGERVAYYADPDGNVVAIAVSRA